MGLLQSSLVKNKPAKWFSWFQPCNAAYISAYTTAICHEKWQHIACPTKRNETKWKKKLLHSSLLDRKLPSCCSCDAAPYAVRGRSCFMVHCNRACGVRAYCKLSQKLVSTGILQCARILHLPQSRSKGRNVVIKKIYSGESGTNTVCPGRSILNLYSKLLYKMWHYFWDIQYLGFYG